MKSLILAGGKGTRFSEETTTKPKPMIEILEKPMLLYIIEHYKSFGIDDFVILGGTKIEYIIDYFSNKFKNIDKLNNLYEIENKVKVQILDTGEINQAIPQLPGLIGGEELPTSVFETFFSNIGQAGSDLTDRYNQAKSNLNQLVATPTINQSYGIFTEAKRQGLI